MVAKSERSDGLSRELPKLGKKEGFVSAPWRPHYLCIGENSSHLCVRNFYFREVLALTLQDLLTEVKRSLPLLLGLNWLGANKFSVIVRGFVMA